MKTVCVFCGSGVGKHPEYSTKARMLGELIAGKNLRLVYGGGNIGLMREVADSALAAGGEVIGVMPQNIVEKEIAHHAITKLHVVNSMHERKALMADLSDAFIALPGGFGTLDEIFEIMTWNQLEIITKPTGLLNIEGYFDHLIQFIRHAVHEKFVRPEHQSNLIVETDANNLLEKLQDFRPVKAEKWIDRLKLDLI
ncbi:MAG TPA: TIGR00730 family Rossman fold protein [Bacteroidales bacterium]|nr:TIGR00730 family Rossman fold protein [Bacteroidales bacterium]